MSWNNVTPASALIKKPRKRKAKRKITLKEKTLTVTIPTSKTTIIPLDSDHVKFGSLNMLQNQSGKPEQGLFFSNLRRGERIKQDEMLTMTKTSKMVYGLIYPDGSSHMTFEVTIAELEKLVKEAKARQKKFKKSKLFPSIGFINLSPDVGMLVRFNKPNTTRKRK